VKDSFLDADGNRVYFYEGATVYFENSTGLSRGTVVKLGRKFVSISYTSRNGKGTTRTVKRLPEQLRSAPQ
jgi:hypothetical protein